MAKCVESGAKVVLSRLAIGDLGTQVPFLNAFILFSAFPAIPLIHVVVISFLSFFPFLFPLFFFFEKKKPYNTLHERLNDFLIGKLNSTHATT